MKKSLNDAVKRSMVGDENAGDWTESDRNALRLFLNSQTGRRYAHAVRNSALRSTVQAVHSAPEALVLACGVAKGQQMMFSLLCFLSGTNPLRLIQHDGEFSLTETRENTGPEESEDDGESSFDGLTSQGSPIFP